MHMPETVINLIIIVLVLAVLGAIVGYIIREKKRGSKCIGCPYARECAARREGGCSGQGK